MNGQKEELIIPTDLKTYLSNIAESRFGYKLGDPWKYSEETLGVVVPILRENTSDRQYITMYEVLKELNIKDTGDIDQVELQNKSGMAIFVRAGTIFEGKTQPRAVQHSGVYSNEKETINVRCVNAFYGINRGTEMKFGDIAPPSVTINLMSGGQLAVWDSVKDYGSELNREERGRRYGAMPTVSIGTDNITVNNPIPESLPEDVKKALNYVSECKSQKEYAQCDVHTFTASNGSKITRILRVYPTEDISQVWSGELSDENIETVNRFVNVYNNTKPGISNPNDLLGKIKKKQSILDDMMQKVPLFDNQVGAIIFNPVGVIAVETFDHPKSWEAIKKEIIEKYGDNIKEKQTEHIFELKLETILPSFRKFIEGLDKFIEKTIRKDEYSETRIVRGEEVMGEYTLVKGQPIHVLLIKEK